MTAPVYLTADQFAATLGISSEMARKVLRRAGAEGKPYKGVSLDVRFEKGRGSAGGTWLVNQASVERIRNHRIAEASSLTGEGQKGSEFDANNVVALPIRQGEASTPEVPNSLPQGFRIPENKVPNTTEVCGTDATEFGTSPASNNIVTLPVPVPAQKVPNSGPDCGSAWLTADQFASLAGITDRAARLAMQAGTYRGYALTIDTVAGRGGRGGISYRVDATTLPPDLYERWRATQAPASVPGGVVISGDVSALPASALALWRLSLISDALRHPEGSAARRRALMAGAGLKLTPDGRTRRVGLRTLYDWVNRYQNGGVGALNNAPKGTKGIKRVVVSRAFDDAARAAGLGPADLEAISAALELYIRSLWSEGTAGWRNISLLASTQLQALAHKAGWPQPTPDACAVNRRMVETWRDYEILAIQKRDAKAFFDHYLPRVARNRDAYAPMHLVIGDVHHLDIVVERPDGTDVYPKIIAWHDIATNRVYASLIFLERGEGVKRWHVGMSFAAMVEAWGLPRTLYLDNGSEYTWDGMMQTFADLSAACHGRIDVRMVEHEGGVRELRSRAISAVKRARPYNAPAKPIEGLFSVLTNTIFPAMPGYIGGDRTKAKKEHVGRPPKAFSGGYEAFHAALDTALEFYHCKPQGGFLDGKSPDAALRAAIADGWQAVRIDADTLLMAFAEEERRVVRKGRVSCNGITWYADDLLTMTGQTVRVRVAPHAPDVAYILDNTGLICAAQPEQTYDYLDGAGAREQARRAKVLHRAIAEKRRNTCRLDLVAEMGRHVQAVAAQAGGVPQIPGDVAVSLSPEAEAMASASRALADQRAERATAKAAVVEYSQFADIETEDASGLSW